MSIITLVVVNYVLMPFIVGKNNVVTVPDVRGLTKAEASEILDQHGLSLQYAGQIDTVGVEPGTVVDQDPPPGMVVKKGRKIEVTFARKPIILPEIDTLLGHIPADSESLSPVPDTVGTI